MVMNSTSAVEVSTQLVSPALIPSSAKATPGRYIPEMTAPIIIRHRFVPLLFMIAPPLSESRSIQFGTLSCANNKHIETGKQQNRRKCEKFRHARPKT